MILIGLCLLYITEMETISIRCTHYSGDFYLVFQIRWLLEDEIVSALRHSWVISATTLQKVTQHVLSSSGRQHCHCEDVPLQFVFGPEQSLEKFKEARILSRAHTSHKFQCFDRKNIDSATLCIACIL